MIIEPAFARTLPSLRRIGSRTDGRRPLPRDHGLDRQVRGTAFD